MVLRPLGIKIEDPRFGLIQRALLRTLLHEWGTKSYEFELAKAGSIDPEYEVDEDDAEGGSGNPDALFRGHCYFGSKPGGVGPGGKLTQDCFPHIKSYLRQGGSRRSLDFLLQHI